jgi:hypothetical protein
MYLHKITSASLYIHRDVVRVAASGARRQHLERGNGEDRMSIALRWEALHGDTTLMSVETSDIWARVLAVRDASRRPAEINLSKHLTTKRQRQNDVAMPSHMCKSQRSRPRISFSALSAFRVHDHATLLSLMIPGLSSGSSDVSSRAAEA